MYEGTRRSDLYNITIKYPGSEPRSFVGLLQSKTWELEKRPCLYVGDSQAGPIDEVESPNDSVIEGDYTEYKVESIFATDFIYSHFDKSRC